MIFEIQKDQFYHHIQKIQSIVETNTTVPILTNVRISVEDDFMEISATDMEVGIRDSTKVKVEHPGSITVSAKKLYEVLKELSEGVVRFQVEENNWIKITCGLADFRLVGTSDEDFPKLPEYNEEKLVVIASEKLEVMVKKIL